MARFTTNFESEALKRPITIEAVLPADHMVLRTQPLPKKNMPYKTLYLLEGVTGNASGIFNYSKLMGLAEDYNLAVVCIGGENKWWSSMTAMNENFGDMVTRDVVNFTRRVFCLSDRREDTFIDFLWVVTGHLSTDLGTLNCLAGLLRLIRRYRRFLL